MTILSNSITSELEVPDLESENDQETGANVYGTKITYRGNSYTADQDLSFSIEFEDNRYLEVYMLFKIYDEYCRYKNLGLIQLDLSDTEDSVWVNYTFNKVLHDQFAIYKFITADDGMTILYWGKYTGVYPTGAPRGSFSSMSGQDGQKHTVQFKAQFFRDMDPITITEFNKLCDKMSYSGELPLYNSDEHRINGEWAVSPYIVNTSLDSRGYEKRNLSDIDKLTQYQLRWRK
jgi:hypothetical protein